MKFKIWDNQNQCWYKPTYQADKGQLEEIFMTQSGELCMRKMINGEEKFFHESVLTYEVKTESGVEQQQRFTAFLYSGTKDGNGKKLYVGDQVKDVDGIFEIKFGKYHIDGDMATDFNGFYLENVETKLLHHFTDANDLELIEKGGDMK